MLPKFKHIYIEIYGENIWWIHCTPDQFRKRYRYEFGKEYDKELPNGRMTIVNKRGTNVIILWCNKLSGFKTMAHEIFHSAWYIMKDKDIPLDDSSDEAYAYLIELITKQVLKKWRF